MKNQIVITTTLVFLWCFNSNAQWTVDPFCPSPSDHVTRYPYYGNCSIYWECYEGEKYVMNCPEGLEFNAPLQQCDTPSIANCDAFASTTDNPDRQTADTDTPTEETGETEVTTPSDTTTALSSSTTISSSTEDTEDTDQTEETTPNDATTVLPTSTSSSTEDTEDTDQTEETTPDDATTVLPTSTSSSTEDTEDTDQTEETSPSDTTTTSGPEPVCPLNDTLIYFPVIGDCTKYWECFGGNRYLYNCPAGLWWHQKISGCDYPGDYCDDSITGYTTEPTNPTPDTTATETPTTTGTDPRCGEGGTSYWPQPGDCQRYVECIDGESYLVDCPPNLYFSDKLKDCVRVDESECCLVYECIPNSE